MSNYEYSGFDRISHNEWLGFTDLGLIWTWIKFHNYLSYLFYKKMKKETKIKWQLIVAHHKQMSS